MPAWKPSHSLSANETTGNARGGICPILVTGAAGRVGAIGRGVVQFLLGHVSVQTTEKYLGCKQKLRDAVNDLIALGASKELVLPGAERL